MKNLLLYVFIAFAFYKGWTHLTKEELVLEKNQNGFAEVFMPANYQSGVVHIFAPKNCPKKAGKRADALEKELQSRGVSVQRRSSFSLRVNDPTPEIRESINHSVAVLRGKIPIVFLNGKASANPSADEVVAEWRL